MATIWDRIRVGRMELPHRLAPAPMTRSRAELDGVPGEHAAEYYAQRASLGLLITEGVQPSANGQGYFATPRLHAPEHVAGRRKVTDAVHAEGAKIFVQLIHVGGMSHPDSTLHHRQPVAASAIAPGEQMSTESGLQTIPEPRALTTEEVAVTVQDFRLAAQLAIEAGADGVEIYGANGYIVHQFFAPNANHRTDAYGGPIADRVRFAVEVAQAVAEEIGADRTAIRLSPCLPIGGLDEGPGSSALYRELVAALAPLNLSYLHLMYAWSDELLAEIRSTWPPTLMVLRLGRMRETLDQDIVSSLADMTSVGRWALANPDFVERLRANAPFKDADQATVYGGGTAGYTDYPRLHD